ncbi:MAG: CGNR zinc finger domain-containing protein [Streptomyces sp.]
MDVYVDTSRPGTRRYCSESCLNRERVAAWRARNRSTASPS